MKRVLGHGCHTLNRIPAWCGLIQETHKTECLLSRLSFVSEICNPILFSGILLLQINSLAINALKNVEVNKVKSVFWQLLSKIDIISIPSAHIWSYWTRLIVGFELKQYSGCDFDISQVYETDRETTKYIHLEHLATNWAWCDLFSIHNIFPFIKNRIQ